MKKETIFVVFIIFLALVSVFLLYNVLSPFLESILWAVLLALFFYPLYRRLQRFLKRGGALPALVMTLFVLGAIVLPFSFLLASLAVEAVRVYHQVEDLIQTGQLQALFDKSLETPTVRRIWESLSSTFDLSETRPFDLVLKNLQQLSKVLLTQASMILKGLTSMVAGFFFTLLSLFYLFKDGDRFLEAFKEVVPLRAAERDILLLRFKEMIEATFLGGILIAGIQGCLGGIAFWVLGLSSPLFWGTLMAFLSLIPIGGTALVWAPAAVILLVKGAYLKGILLLAFGILGISTVDNFLRPVLISAKTNIHPLLLFFSVLGGIQAFGFIGLIVGPLTVTFFLTLVEIYRQGLGHPEA
jgi:predicted PurR-regulated permease PerM